MNKLFTTQTAMAIGLIAMVTDTVIAQETTYPNVIFILADDFGWNDLGCMGSKYYETPNLDRLANSGIKFTNAYAACQVSSPSRASIMTGKYTPRHNITNYIGAKSGKEWRTMNRHNKMLPTDYSRNLSADEYTLPECLRENGYTTFIAGKWHLGDIGSYPEDHGFDINKGGWLAATPRGGYFVPYKNPKLPDGPNGENLSVRLGDETINFIREHTQNCSSPFFVYLSFYAVHDPIQTTKEKWSYFREKAHQTGIQKNGFLIDRTLPVRQVQDNPVYAGLVKQMDESIGNVLNAVTELGLDKNTMIIFTSDNGGVTSGDSYSTSLLPLRGGKGRQWEGGLRVPLLIKYPGCKAAVCTTPIIGTDLYPTILDYVGIKAQPQQHKDGISIMPIIESESIPDHSLFWHYPHYGNQGGEPTSIIRDGNWKLIYYHEDQHYELYNIDVDLSENKSFNIQYPRKLKRMQTLLLKWLREVKAQMPVPDIQYDPKKENNVKQLWRTKVLQEQEKLRKEMLQPSWKPNKNWWGSMATVD